MSFFHPFAGKLLPPPEKAGKNFLRPWWEEEVSGKFQRGGQPRVTFPVEQLT